MLSDIHAAAPELSGATRDSNSRNTMDLRIIVQVSHYRPAITKSTGPQCGSIAAHKALNDDFPTRVFQKNAMASPTKHAGRVGTR